MSQIKNSYAKLFHEYSKGAKGPYIAEAASDYFQSKILEEMANLIKDVE